MKENQIRELVNELRDIAIEYHGTQQLRERIARTVRAAMPHGAENSKSLHAVKAAPVLNYSVKNIELLHRNRGQLIDE
ncbi:Eaa protein [Salmonella enterica]|nr:Eaa protein [Salmonella enterica]